jgi:hypothetical protein
MRMKTSDLSTYARMTVTLTVEGRLSLASDALAAAKKTRNEQRRRRLCEEAVNHLRSVVQDQ